MDEINGLPATTGALRTREMTRDLEQMNRLGDQFARTMGRAFQDVAVRGKGFGDVLRGLGQQLAKLAL